MQAEWVLFSKTMCVIIKLFKLLSELLLQSDVKKLSCTITLSQKMAVIQQIYALKNSATKNMEIKSTSTDS